LIVIGVHTPEFSFEHEIVGVRQAINERAIDYPVALDNDYEIWSAFDNHYWPALYFVDAEGVIRDRHFGEGRYEESESVIQRLLGLERELVAVEGLGVEAEANRDQLRTPEDVSRLRAQRALRVTERRASRFSSACSSTARLRARHTAWTSTRTGTACSGTAASTSSCASTTGSASGRWRSRCSSPGAEAYVFTFG
jgi:hypothetical protein